MNTRKLADESRKLSRKTKGLPDVPRAARPQRIILKLPLETSPKD
jgi:hypothetical protein